MSATIAKSMLKSNYLTGRGRRHRRLVSEKKKLILESKQKGDLMAKITKPTAAAATHDRFVDSFSCSCLASCCRQRRHESNLFAFD